MPKAKKIPALATVAAQQEETKKRRGFLAAVGAMLGMPEKAVAKMTKVTEKYSERHEKVEESDEEDEEEEESTGGSTDGGTESTDDGESTGSESTSGEEEEESDGSEEEEGSSEEEEERAVSAKIAKAHKRAFAAAQAAYEAHAAKLGPELAGSLALRSPERLYREARKATGATGIDATMTALSRSRAQSAQASAAVIQKTAKLEARVAKVETQGRKARVEAMVESAKVAGRAPTRELRAHLREHGMAYGSTSLGKLIAGLPVVAPKREKIPAADARGASVGLPSGDDQERMMQQAMAGLSEKDREEFRKLASEKSKALNGAGSRE